MGKGLSSTFPVSRVGQGDLDHLRDPGIFYVIAGDLSKLNFSSVSGVKL